MDKEMRNQQIQLQTNDNKVAGIIKYNTRSQLIGGAFYEVISPRAFQYDTVKALWNHDTNIVLGSTRSKTLSLEDATKGLKFEIDMPTTRADIYENIKRGDVDGTSFGMIVNEDSWNYDEQYPVRTILKAELLEISPTPFPAYEGNTISARALDKAKNINKSEVDIMEKEQLKAMIEEIRNEEAAKAEIRGSIMNTDVKVPEVSKGLEQRNAFRKMINREQLNDTELRTIGASTSDGGGYLLGDEFYNRITEFKRSQTDLSKYFNVMPVGARSGILPVEVLGALLPMQIVGENDTNKPAAEPKFTQVKYSVKDMREVYKLANSFVKDQQVDIMGYLARKIAKKDTYSTNYYLLNGFDGKSGILTGTDFTKENNASTSFTLPKIKTLINKFDPELRKGLVIITNTDGYSLLSTLAYTTGQLVMQENATLDSGFSFLGHEVIEMSNKELPNDDTNGVPFIFINGQEAITIFERQAYEVKASEEAGFDDDTTKVRVTVRKDIKTIDKDACKVVYFKN